MSISLLKPVEPERLAEAGRWLEAAFPVAGMPRLLEALALVAGQKETLSAEGRLRFFRDGHGAVRVEGEVQARLPLRCQRCLEPALLPVSGQFELMVVDSEAQADELPPEVDPLIRKQRLVDVVGLMEDELIVALPQVARHESLEDCGPVARNEALEAADEIPVPADEPPSAETGPTQRPFQVLAGLKGGKDSK